MNARVATARRWLAAIGAIVALASWRAVAGDTVDFSEMATPLCEVDGLRAPPPSGWFNVPIESADPTLRGCQMMRTRGDGALVGIARVLSVTLSAPTTDPPWQVLMLTFERDNVARMGYAAGEMLWRRDDVPVAGEGFEGGFAVGLSARIQGNDAPQEIHLVLFESGLTKYVVSLLTPGREVGDGGYYERNVADFAALIGSFTASSHQVAPSQNGPQGRH